MRIPFNKPALTGNEKQYVLESIESGQTSGDGPFSKRCQKWFEEYLGCSRMLLTPSCTHALEMAAILIDVKEGDEVIMPSYTFVSTANAFVLRGANVVFVDIRPDTMNIDESKIESAITSKTKAIVPVHYAGVACEMDAIMAIANKYNLFVIEDAAQGMMSRYKGEPLGTIGHIGAYSFHETKNYTSAGEGGGIVINDKRFVNRSEIIRDKGTNRRQFFLGMVDKYSWVDIGSSYLMGDVSAAYLWGNIEMADKINRDRLHIWHQYYSELKTLKDQLALPLVPVDCVHNAHMFYIKVRNPRIRDELLQHLKNDGILATFHYTSLHTSEAGRKFGYFSGIDEFTTKESNKLIRLPLYFGMGGDLVEEVVHSIKQYFQK